MKTKSFLRAAIIFALLLSLGWFGLWILDRPGAKIKIESSDNSSVRPVLSGDTFYNFGGRNPEDAVKLLISALEKKDLALAVKYFVPEIREAESEDLKKLNDSKLLSDLIKTLKDLKGGYAPDSLHWRYKVTDETGQPALEIELLKNKSGLWKISSL